MGQYMPSSPEFQQTNGPSLKLPKEPMAADRNFREIPVVLFTEMGCNLLGVIAVTTFLKSLTTLYNLSSDYGGEE